MSGEDDLPSWDEFGAEQLDYGEDEEEVAAPTGDDPGDPGEEPSTSSTSAATAAAAMRSNARVTAVRTTSGSSSGRAAATAAAAAPRNIGPSLPPGFDLGGGGGAADADDDEEEQGQEDEDPEDPGDPGEQQPSVDDAELAPTLPSLPMDAAAAAAAPPAPRVPAVALVDEEEEPEQEPDDEVVEPSEPPPEPEPAPRRPPNLARRGGPRFVPRPRVIGPAIPSDFLPFEANGGDEEVDGSEDEEEEPVEEEEEDTFGPALPPGMNGAANAAAAAEMEMPMMDEEEDDDSDVIGPMPARSDAEERAAEARRAQMRAEKEREDKKLKREEWMLQLPKKLNSYGLGPRSFSKSNGADGDSSSWTNGPGTSAASDPAASKDAMDRLATAERDSAQARIASSLNSGRNESMLDSHARKRKAGEEAVAGPSAPTVRRPFDIEKDMQVRGLKSASTAEIKEKCGQLSSRFGNSGSAKFL